jgi:hypothetical protein
MGRNALQEIIISYKLGFLNWDSKGKRNKIASKTLTNIPEKMYRGVGGFYVGQAHFPLPISATSY